MVSLILCAAGKSSRFPGKPKWMLTSPNGNLMIQECLMGLDLANVTDVYVTLLKEHVETYCGNLDDVKVLFDTPNLRNTTIHITVIDESTTSQSETIYETITRNSIMGPIFIKDCDNQFTHKVTKGNYVCTLLVNDENPVIKIHNKSFIEHNRLGHVLNICEKKIISNCICVGGYSFEDAQMFACVYLKCKDITDIHTSELYVSNIIYRCMLDDVLFMACNVSGYIDWGTIVEWTLYRSSFKTLFVDIDGVLLVNSGQYFDPKWGSTEPIHANVDYLRRLHEGGKTKIILTTARSDTPSVRALTVEQLVENSIPYDDIVFGLFHGKRYLINDYAPTNTYPTAIAVNIPRNSDALPELL